MNPKRITTPTEPVTLAEAKLHLRGVDDTAAEAAALRLRGVLPVCLFTGSDREVPDARRIYGQAMERLPAIGWLADAVTRLIRGQLRRG